jgi:hypothetical protein
MTTDGWRLGPGRRVPCRPVTRRLRMVARMLIFAAQSARSKDLDFVSNATQGIANVVLLSLLGLGPGTKRVECNICGWRGRSFYPNVGPGYNERATVCPGCQGQDRHRALLAILASRTHVFRPGEVVVEVAPMRGMEELLKGSPGVRYTSFDLERHAMEAGDITDMRFASSSVDWFIAFHVLEHIPRVDQALAEVRRILKPGGAAILQVPIDCTSTTTVEYGKPDPRDVNHVRMYGTDFADKLISAGFDVTSVRVSDGFDSVAIEHYGMNREPIFFAVHPRI